MKMDKDTSKGVGVPLESGKGKKTDSPLELPEKTTALPLILAQ